MRSEDHQLLLLFCSSVRDSELQENEYVHKWNLKHFSVN